MRPVSLTARVNRLERDLRPQESWASIESRAQLTRWLVGCDEAAELYDDYIYLSELHGATGVLASPAGRAATLAMIESLFAFDLGSHVPDGDIGGLHQGRQWHP